MLQMCDISCAGTPLQLRGSARKQAGQAANALLADEFTQRCATAGGCRHRCTRTRTSGIDSYPRRTHMRRVIALGKQGVGVQAWGGGQGDKGQRSAGGSSTAGEQSKQVDSLSETSVCARQGLTRPPPPTPSAQNDAVKRFYRIFPWGLLRPPGVFCVTVIEVTHTCHPLKVITSHLLVFFLFEHFFSIIFCVVPFLP